MTISPTTDHRGLFGCRTRSAARVETLLRCKISDDYLEDEGYLFLAESEAARFRFLLEMKPDFRATVNFTKSRPVMLGYRPDFAYDPNEDGTHYMIWPIEFFRAGESLPANVMIMGEVDADFHIVNAQLRETIHRGKLKVGVKFRLYEGWQPVGEGVVSQVFL